MHSFLIWPIFQRARADIQQYFLPFFGSNENFKFAFEINWPLKRRKRCESLSRKNSWKLIRNLPLKNHAYTRYVPLKINTGCSFSEWIILSSINPKYKIRFTQIVQMDNLKLNWSAKGGIWTMRFRNMCVQNDDNLRKAWCCILD